MVYIANGLSAGGQASGGLQGLPMASAGRPAEISMAALLYFRHVLGNYRLYCLVSMIRPDLTRRGCSNSLSSSGYDDGRGPPGYPRRRMGRINHGAGPSPPPMAGGG